MREQAEELRSRAGINYSLIDKIKSRSAGAAADGEISHSREQPRMTMQQKRDEMIMKIEEQLNN